MTVILNATLRELVAQRKNAQKDELTPEVIAMITRWITFP